MRVALRRFTYGAGDRRIPCPARGYGHEASNVVFETAPVRADDQGHESVWPPSEFVGNPSWPSVCVHCGEPCDDVWEWQVHTDRWYRSDGVGQWVLRDLPQGAMFDAWWLPGRWHGDDGIALTVVCPPGGLSAHWNVDAPARNCTRQDEPHRCWCRHGSPKLADLTVDKSCDTCSAGAGSIQTSHWHGFLRSGALVA